VILQTEEAHEGQWRVEAALTKAQQRNEHLSATCYGLRRMRTSSGAWPSGTRSNS
jgi:hypothetical protein